MSLPRYPEYKASGISWLGDVPTHWDIQPLKRACNVFPSNVDKKSYEGEEPVRLCNYTDVYYNDLISDDMPFMDATATSEQVKKFTLHAGDTIVTKDSETADDIAISAYVPNDLPGVVCGYHLSMIRPTPLVEGRFIKRLFDSAYAKASCHVSANGLTRVGLGQYALDNLVLPFPPKGEQRSIAVFLDRETTKIDTLIAEQVQLIALLKEKRQAVISHAVTKGMIPDAPMKASGIEWRGEVPAHWLSLALDVSGGVALYFVLWLPLADGLFAAVPALAGVPLINRVPELLLVGMLLLGSIENFNKLGKMLGRGRDRATTYPVKGN